MSGVTESVVEEACLEWFRGLGFATAYGPNIGPEGMSEERSSWEGVILVARLRQAVARIIPELPHSAVDQAVATVLRAESQNLMSENLRIHQLMSAGVSVEHRTNDGAIRYALARLVNF